MTISTKLRKALTPTLLFLICFSGLMLITGVLWIGKKFGSVPIDSIVFHAQHSLLGTPVSLIKSFSKRVLICILSSLCLLVFYRLTSRALIKKTYWSAVVILLCIGLLLFENRLKGISYLSGNYTQNYFIETNYVPLSSSEIVFPQKKQNVIIILAESIETTFFSNTPFPLLTPKLEKLQTQNFSCTLWQGTNLGWTMGSLTGFLFGVPLFVPRGNLYTPGNEAFLPGALSLLSIFEHHGYDITCILGSDSRFAGKRNIFTTHSTTYSIYDQNYFEKKQIPTSGPWGLRDALLLEEAKDIILDRAYNQEIPFFILLQTSDTHNPAVSYNDYPQPYGDERDAFVAADYLISDFVGWIEKQDFYENTTILILGDHQYMGRTVGPIALPPLRSLYNTIINPVISCELEQRHATMLDMGATLLEAIGAELPAHSFGLGRSLLHPTPTLLEQFGHTELPKKFAGQSNYYNSFFLNP